LYDIKGVFELGKCYTEDYKVNIRDEYIQLSERPTEFALKEILNDEYLNE
ncbi:27427_t:CDS:2, partial [Dentiscutata erythropus]